MESRAELEVLRGNIDSIDTELVELFNKRMGISEQIAKVKAQGNIAVTDTSREEKIIAKALSGCREDMKSETQSLMRTIMAMSKLRQNDKLGLSDAVSFPPSSQHKTGNIKAAYQGVPGAWSQQGAETLFPGAETQACEYFEDVFTAVKEGRADYGVLPIENSQTGAIGEVYDLLRRYNCYIVSQVWISAAQCLLALPDTRLTDIREVFSHPQGFNQCSRYLKNRSWDLTACRNTAFAASMVSERGSNRYAAIGSRKAASIYGLNVLAPDIADNKNNKTRFIAISNKPVYDASSDITSITFSTPHKSGALCAVLQSFMLSGINMSRIESRPASTGNYRFFADLQTNAETAMDALRMAAAQCEYFEVLGCYSDMPEPSFAG